MLILSAYVVTITDLASKNYTIRHFDYYNKTLNTKSQKTHLIYDSSTAQSTQMSSWAEFLNKWRTSL